MRESSMWAVRTRHPALTVIGVLGFAAALAVASKVSIPLPNTPVPITLQPLIVVLAGLWLGPVAGVMSMVIYLGAGALGMPVFAPQGAPGLARLLGPTGGYLLAYPFAAFVTGVLAPRGAGFLRRFGAAVAGMLAIYAGGVAQLVVLTGSIERAAALGVLPFVALDVVKAFIAAIIRPSRG